MTGAVEVERGALDDMRPRPFLNGELISIFDCFYFASSGVETTRDHLAYALDAVSLNSTLRQFQTLPVKKAQEHYSPTRKAAFSTAYAYQWDHNKVVRVSYRPFDLRYLNNVASLVDWPRPKLQAAWGELNLGLFALPNGTGTGPACWSHSLLPDRHAFRGSYGGYAFPLYDRRAGHGPYNLKGELVRAIGAAYGARVTPETVFDAILCLLSASSYTTRFAEDLEDTFPHIPFPASRAVFDEAARIGAEIRSVETFARIPRAAFLRGVARAETAPTGPLAITEWWDGGITLCADGSGRIGNVPFAVWEFAVSGYRVLPRWLAAREGIAIGPTLIPELRDLVGRVAELIDLFRRADTVLESTLADTLTRAALGFGDEETSAAHD